MQTEDEPKKDRRRLRAHMFSVALALSAAGLAYLASVHVFHQAPVTTDENSYIFQAVNFAEGRIAREAPPFPRAFAHRMIIQNATAGWLSRYPPLHAIWLVPGLVLGNLYLMSALAAALSVLLMAAIARRVAPGLGAGLAPALLVASPYFIFMHGTLLSHTSGILAVSVMLATLVGQQALSTAKRMAALHLTLSSQKALQPVYLHNQQQVALKLTSCMVK